MRISIGFSGAAGSGVNTSGMFLGQLLSQKGYYILGDKEYASIIKGDNNDFFLYVSDKDYFITQTIDYFFAFDDYSVTKNQKMYVLKEVYNIKDQAVKYKNTFCFGASLKLLGIALQEGIDMLAQSYSGDILDQNKECLQKGYEYIPES
jgi:Pyruvate/2-oxoacid:ferredoxin oxidoreductase gamma subunit